MARFQEYKKGVVPIPGRTDQATLEQYGCDGEHHVLKAATVSVDDQGNVTDLVSEFDHIQIGVCDGTCARGVRRGDAGFEYTYDPKQ